ncbi:hypothetical protein vBRpoPV13_65 [Ruegeria phage vB_RpoP-V13]|uniref:Uncharacterized protein n=1 Tax=Ruegeria phage vB_RpoP-V13 TaxID=2218612 RepID=A0A2Z4QGK5_9CAUD|nr:hypothetical protein HYP63_gp65 [Ruegeria phage vB_RpoP-V13]AWY09422.1 hypothetical protein vBRpoPV13_65 [Ruegeria phage vB_RpoP-V13]
MKQYLIMAGVSLLLLGGAFAFGYHKGTVNQIAKFEDDRQQLQNDILDLNVSLQERADEIRRLRTEKEGLINELENAALDAEGADAPGVAATGGLQRLEKRWGQSPASSN